MSDHVTLTQTGDVAVITIDDGKANAYSHEILDSVLGYIDQIETTAKALILAGRPGRFSGGFDLKVMLESPESALLLLRKGGDLMLRMYTLNMPVIIAATGHAVAAGAFMLLAVDERIGEEGPFKVGLPEVAIGMPLPHFVVEIARDRLSKRHFAGMNLATIYSPSEAIDAGYFDRIVPEGTAIEAAIARATELAATLDPGAFRACRTIIRGETAKRLEAFKATDTKID